jgi:NAD(P)-dependent dehydrogenase (short-subunit alcohol dehydrogenase family)
MMSDCLRTLPGNSGIGLVTTKILAENGAKVYIASRSTERVHAAMDELAKASSKPLDLHFLQLDLLDLRSVKAAAAQFSAQETHLDILVNNAGVRVQSSSSPCNST